MRAVIVPFLFAIFMAPAASLAGDLTPPAGPPASTMKTLDQVEARTPLSQQTTPGNANYRFIINQPGSYYLTGNLVASGGRSGILITTEHVTLDLNGFTLLGTGAQVAIETSVTYLDGVTIRNGKIDDWAYGILALGDGALVEDITVTNCDYGIRFDAASFTTNISRCIVYNTTNIAISAGESSRITDCVVRGATIGIQANGGSLISGCTVAAAGIGYECVATMVRECFAHNCTTPYDLIVGSVKSESFP